MTRAPVALATLKHLWSQALAARQQACRGADEASAKVLAKPPELRRLETRSS